MITNLIVIGILVGLVTIYFANKRRIDRVVRVKNKEVIDKIDDPITVLTDEIEKTKKYQLILSENTREMSCQKRMKADDNIRKQEEAEEQRKLAAYNAKTNPAIAKKHLANALKKEDQIATNKKMIETLTKRIERQKEISMDLASRRNDLTDVLNDAKANKKLQSVGNLSDLLSTESYTELNQLIAQIDLTNRTIQYEQDYVDEVNASQVKPNMRVDEEFARMFGETPATYETPSTHATYETSTTDVTVADNE